MKAPAPEELNHGKTFILQLPATSDGTRTGQAARGAGAGGGRGNSKDSAHWIEMLRGDVARRWYDIYRHSDWAAPRAEATDVFPLGHAAPDS